MSRTKARETAFKLLFQYNIQKELDIEEEEDITAYTRHIIEGVQGNYDEIASLISGQLENWSYDRLANVDKTILQIATFELIYTDDIPVGVGINEAVELAHTYGDDKSPAFINGVLSKIVKQKEK